MTEPSLILASSSSFRQQLLTRLNLPFQTISPNIDETPLKEESPTDFVRRLSYEKAQVISASHPHSLVIGSDQCALLDGEILGKPGTHENAMAQLRKAQGKEVVFYTGLSVQHAADGLILTDCIEFRVGFRTLTDGQLENYLAREQPYNCAGSFKSEGYGITLFSHMTGDDPTALIGLPLIRLTSMLEQAGIQVV